MALQKKINGTLVAGIVGEFSDASPKTGRAYITYGKDETSLPEFGKFFSFTEVALSTGSSAKTTCAKQGVGTDTWSMGILVNPKEHFQIGFINKKTMAQSGISATIATRGHIWVMANTKTVAGADVYADADGNLGDKTLASGVKVNGAKWLKSVALADGATEVLSEISIDNPSLNGSEGPGSL